MANGYDPYANGRVNPAPGAPGSINPATGQRYAGDTSSWAIGGPNDPAMPGWRPFDGGNSSGGSTYMNPPGAVDWQPSRPGGVLSQPSGDNMWNSAPRSSNSPGVKYQQDPYTGATTPEMGPGGPGDYQNPGGIPYGGDVQPFGGGQPIYGADGRTIIGYTNGISTRVPMPPGDWQPAPGVDLPGHGPIGPLPGPGQFPRPQPGQDIPSPNPLMTGWVAQAPTAAQVRQQRQTSIPSLLNDYAHGITNQNSFQQGGLIAKAKAAQHPMTGYLNQLMAANPGMGPQQGLQAILQSILSRLGR